MSQTTSATSIPPAVPDAPAPEANPPEAGEFQEREAQIMVASQWKLIWWKFRKHKLAMYSAAVVIAIYTVALFMEFFAPFPPDQYAANYTYAPPQALHLIDNSSGSPKLGLYVTGYKVAIDKFSLRRMFVEDPEQKIPVQLLAKGWEYKLLGIIPMNRHIIGPVDGVGPMYLLGADSMGRDLLSRISAGTRISMSIGLLGVAISLVLGILLGGISGYYGGAIDNIIQRLIEFLRALPTIPLWMSMAAAMPVTWPPLYVYFGITIILSFIGWTGLARVVRGRFLALREEDFVLAARLDGAAADIPDPAPHGAVLLQPHHRLDHPGHPGDDPGRNGAELPGLGLAPADRQLGRLAPGCPECTRGIHGALAPGAGHRSRDRRALAQLPGRRSARRSRSVRSMTTDDE